jgi:hypothetical protein
MTATQNIYYSEIRDEAEQIWTYFIWKKIINILYVKNYKHGKGE